MKAVFIVFSPSGHTLIAARKFMSLLEDNGISCHMINITKNDKYLQDSAITKTLVDDLGEQHLLIPCAPVYAGHCEQNMLRTIRALPLVKEKQIPAIPLVTYGGVHSSVALEEMGKALSDRGYIPIMGIKIAAEHTLTATFKKRINPNLPGTVEAQILAEAAEITEKVVNDKIAMVNVGKKLAYAPFMKRIMFRIFSQEKIHGKYKKVAINTEKCIGCKRCVAACPVNMFAYIDNTIQMVRNPKYCILCAECYHQCPIKAVVYPYIEVAKKRLSNGFAELENPQSEIYQ
jgi:hypothetical protein